ncbi:hypothetical protein K493DRAFT_305732 [Basidiobolus meristosporus CBS 931.73]|uniref:Uncharacterized protein n=1 Tax=Basidiobolus meristosporus CBS 931.73 TaxID=1314790 RepID=A0A1Y1XUS3_9FUNG|nr:hypothetical protein K493DRAFT_305732 [Basidiobolus meristosporus CBS 931.73]|eukprot:ORX89463.1 hypothetical protein K493DRAFT_305732 [Basidiobolus meristosporus CBS 931.73]
MKLMKSGILSIGILGVATCSPMVRNEPPYVLGKRDDNGPADYFLKGLASLMVKLDRTKPEDLLTKLSSGTVDHLQGAALSTVADIKSKMVAILQSYKEVASFTLSQMKDKIGLKKLQGLANATTRNIEGLAKEAKVRIANDAKQKNQSQGEVHALEVELEDFLKSVMASLKSAQDKVEVEYKHHTEPDRRNMKKFNFGA